MKNRKTKTQDNKRIQGFSVSERPYPKAYPAKPLQDPPGYWYIWNDGLVNRELRMGNVRV